MFVKRIISRAYSKTMAELDAIIYEDEISG